VGTALESESQTTMVIVNKLSVKHCENAIELDLYKNYMYVGANSEFGKNPVAMVVPNRKTC